MGANPISYLEIEAYSRSTLRSLTAWQVRLIRRIDAAVLAAVDKKTPKSGSGDETAIPASNPGGIKAMFRGLMASRNTATTKPKR